MKKTLFLLMITCSSFTLFAQQDTTFYSVVAKGKITGYRKDWQQEKNEYRYIFQFNDRGRGDSTGTILHISNDGLISSLETKGVDYYKNPYLETFSIQGDSAIWIVNGERKSKKYDRQFYLSNEAKLINWVVKQPNKRATVLPDGAVHIDEPIQKKLTVNGMLIHLKLFPVYYEPTPTATYYWMTDDQKFFATVNSWQSMIRKGYEGMIDTLLAAQEAASQPYYTNELKNNSKQLSSHVILTHVNVFQPATTMVKNDMTVEIKNGKITAVYPALSVTKALKADTIIDCKGKFLMPGLWDMHGHYQIEEGALYLAGGVTHIRDMGNDKLLLSRKKQIEENKLLGPDINYLSGFIDKEDPFQGPTGAIIKTLDEGIKAIDEYHGLGYQQIKLYSAIKPEWVKPMAAHAHSLGMRVCGHIPAFMTATQAINDGYDEITHMNFIFLNFMGDTIDTRTPARFRQVGDHAAELDLQSGKVKDLISLMKTKKISLDPTMNVWQGMFDEFKGDTSNYLKPVITWLPKEWLSTISIQTPFGNKEQEPAYRSAFSNMLKMLKLLYDNGILLVAGTDGGEAIALQHELELYVQAGIPSREVLKMATYNAAVDCNMQNIYGSIEPGRSADLVLIDGNPVSNISDIRRVELVIKNHRLYSPKQLLASQGWKYYY